MGLPLNMSNLHAPTVPSGPTTVPVTNGTAANLTLPELQRKKVNLEAELKALGSVLDSHGVDMNTSLLTRDGFPRADIDVAQIRTTRARIIYLRNDYKELMAIVEKQLHAHFASLPDEDEASSAAGEGGGGDDPARASETPADNPSFLNTAPEVLLPLDEPFAKVNSVVDNSPAASAGLKSGDAIRSFGYVNASNHEGLSKLAECAQANVGQNILVKVTRHSPDNVQAQQIQLTLTPGRDWGGRGLLGCHILPL